MEGKKKQSLFKRRVQEAQNKEKKMEVEKVNMTGFPAVIKIDTESNEPSKNKLNSKMDTGFLNQMRAG